MAKIQQVRIEQLIDIRYHLDSPGCESNIVERLLSHDQVDATALAARAPGLTSQVATVFQVTTLATVKEAR